MTATAAEPSVAPTRPRLPPVLLVVALALDPLVVESPILSTGFAVGMVLLLGAIATALVSLGVRYRRSVGIGRLQLRLFLYAGAIFVPIMALAVQLYYESVVVADLRAVVEQNMQPAHASLWLHVSERSVR